MSDNVKNRIKENTSIKFATVFTSSNSADIIVAKSILDSEGIPYFAKNEGLQDLFGLGRTGTGFNLLIGPIKIQVNRNDLSHATKLLSFFLNN